MTGMVSFAWGPKWRLAIGLVLCGVLMIALVQALTYDIPERMKAKTCIAWALANPNATLYLADYIHGAMMFPQGVSFADRQALDPDFIEGQLRLNKSGLPTLGTLALPSGNGTSDRLCICPLPSGK